ncbi:MAG: 2TM domain-containing protein [Flavobacterium sp.]|nr:2TM domain-containing protein [Flavobacterium sp.]
MEIAMQNFKDQRYNLAKKKVKEIKSFYINLTCYLVVIPLLIIINLATFSGVYWFIYSMAGWGAGLLIHGLTAFRYFPFLSSDWEQRKIREFMEVEKQKYQTEIQ